MGLVHERSITLRDDAGVVYERANVYAERQPDGIWHGFIEFVPLGVGAIRRTPRETTQSTLSAVEYWATGLEPLYFEGALDRALREPPADAAAA